MKYTTGKCSLVARIDQSMLKIVLCPKSVSKDIVGHDISTGGMLLIRVL